MKKTSGARIMLDGFKKAAILLFLSFILISHAQQTPSFGAGSERSYYEEAIDTVDMAEILNLSRETYFGEASREYILNKTDSCFNKTRMIAYPRVLRLSDGSCRLWFAGDERSNSPVCVADLRGCLYPENISKLSLETQRPIRYIFTPAGRYSHQGVDNYDYIAIASRPFYFTILNSSNASFWESANEPVRCDRASLWSLDPWRSCELTSLMKWLLNYYVWSPRYPKGPGYDKLNIPMGAYSPCADNEAYDIYLWNRSQWIITAKTNAAPYGERATFAWNLSYDEWLASGGDFRNRLSLIGMIGANNTDNESHGMQISEFAGKVYAIEDWINETNSSTCRGDDRFGDIRLRTTRDPLTENWSVVGRLVDSSDWDRGTKAATKLLYNSTHWWLLYVGGDECNNASGDTHISWVSWRYGRMNGLELAGKNDTGSFMTRVYSVEGTTALHLSVNARVWEGGYLRAAILDSDNKTIQPFGVDNFIEIPAGSDDIRLNGSWRTPASVSRDFRLKFYLKNASFYDYNLSLTAPA